MVDLPGLLDDCEQVARGVLVEDRRRDLAPLVRFESNLVEPIHRWFKFKEAFSSRLVVHLLGDYLGKTRSSVAFLDPFCGVGTSLLAAEEALQRLGAKRLTLRGVEVNPYLEFVASTKLAWDKYDPAFFVRAGAISTNGLRLPRRPVWPSLSTMQNRKFVSRRDLKELLELREKVRLVARGRREQRPLLLGLAAAAEKVFNLRKDGRALRYVPKGDRVSVDEEVTARWDEIAEDLQLGMMRRPVDYEVCRGDGRRSDELFRGRSFDVVLFSPPYLNNIDYTEVYKIELWLLGFISSAHQMVQQRRRTFRSHPSCLYPEFGDARSDEVVRLLGPCFGRLLEYASQTARWRRRLFSEYFADMLRTLRGCSRLLQDDGVLFMIVGNSLHGNSAHPIPVATDLWTCKLARAAGLKVDRLVIGREFGRKRFNSVLLRESIIIMRKGRI